MMMAPRSFLFTRQGPTSTPKAQTKPSRDKNGDSTSSRAKPESLPRIIRSDSMPDVASIAKSSTLLASEPVVIPPRSHKETSKDSRRSDRNDSRGEKRPSSRSKNKPHDVHIPGAVPPAVAALLAITTILPPKKNALRRNAHSKQRLTVDAILQHTQGDENEFSLSVGKSPLDFLLSPPESDSDTTGSDAGMESYLSTRTISSESIASLDDVSVTDSGVSLPSFISPDSRGRRSLPLRKMQTLSSPPREIVVEHPLLKSDETAADEVSFLAFDVKTSASETGEAGQRRLSEPAPRPKFAFTSNLTASLKALRGAARSLSNMRPPYITPDDFLTRSIVALDPSVPFTDERMPPRLEDIPTPALRRYLNPTTNAPIEAHVPSSLSQASRTTKQNQTPMTASIQMQTYRITKPHKTSSFQSHSTSVISRRTSITTTPEEVFAEVAAGPVARQRDMRENSDFIRVAVMEMLMRRHGKLDEKMPGRAKWALPPRKVSTQVYVIGEGGVPARWIGTSA